MNGIEIIEKAEIFEANGYLTLVPGIILALIVLFCGILHLITKSDIMAKLFYGVGIGSIILLTVLSALAHNVFTVPTGRYQYTAYIDETVPVVDFYKRYDNISKDGDIWFFEDKENISINQENEVSENS